MSDHGFTHIGWWGLPSSDAKRRPISKSYQEICMLELSVGHSGHSDFYSIQEALDQVPYGT